MATQVTNDQNNIDIIANGGDQQQKVDNQQIDNNNQDQDQTKVNEELINSLVESKLNDIRSLYEEKLEVSKKQNSGLDKKVSELTKQIKKYESEQLTEQEKLELNKKELLDSWQTIYREKALAKHNLIPAEDEIIDFSSYLFGETEEEVMEKASKLKEFIDNRIKKGIEKGIEERLVNGSYAPTGKGNNNGDQQNIQDMTKEELTEYAIKVSRMPDGKEKSSLLDKLSQEQQRRFRQ
jgi:hypothetical protein